MYILSFLYIFYFINGFLVKLNILIRNSVPVLVQYSVMNALFSIFFSRKSLTFQSHTRHGKTHDSQQIFRLYCKKYEIPR